MISKSIFPLLLGVGLALFGLAGIFGGSGLLAQPQANASAFVPPFVLNGKAKKLYKKQKYRDAGIYATRSLAYLPKGNAPAAEVLGNAIGPMTVKQSGEIDQLWTRVQSFRGDETVKECRSLILKYDSLDLFLNEFVGLPEEVFDYYPENLGEVGLDDLISGRSKSEQRLEEVLTLAADMHYERALQLMGNSHSIDSNRTAYAELKVALSYQASYKDATEKLEHARQAATRKIVILPFASPAAMAAFGDPGLGLVQQAEALLIERTLPLLELYPSNEFVNLLGGMSRTSFGNESARLIELARQQGIDRVYFGNMNVLALGELATARENRSIEGTYKVTERVKTEEGYKNVEKSRKGTIQVQLTTHSFSDQAAAEFRIIDVDYQKIGDVQVISKTVPYTETSSVLISRNPAAWEKEIFQDNAQQLNSGSLPDQGSRPHLVLRQLASQIAFPISKFEQGLRIPVITEPISP